MDKSSALRRASLVALPKVAIRTEARRSAEN